MNTPHFIGGHFRAKVSNLSSKMIQSMARKRNNANIIYKSRCYKKLFLSFPCLRTGGWLDFSTFIEPMLEIFGAGTFSLDS